MAKDVKNRKGLALLLKVMIAFSLTFLVLAGSLYVYGSSTPESHTAAAEIVIDAEVDEVFAKQADVEGYAGWRSNVSEVTDYKSLGEGLATWTEQWGDGNTFDFRITEYVESERLRIKIMDRNGVFTGTWTFEFTDQDGKTHVKLTEEGTIEEPMQRGLYNLFAEPDTMVKQHLDELKRAVEE